MNYRIDSVTFLLLAASGPMPLFLAYVADDVEFSVCNDHGTGLL